MIISVPNSKTKNTKGSIDSTTTEIAVDLYRKKILPFHDGKNDYLLFNDIQDRTYAADRISKMLKYLVKRASLNTDAFRHAPQPTLFGIPRFASRFPNRRKRSIWFGKKCEYQRSHAGKYLSHAPIIADAGVYQAVADKRGLGDEVIWILGYGLYKEIQS